MEKEKSVYLVEEPILKKWETKNVQAQIDSYHTYGWKTPYNAEAFPHDHEESDQPSETIPDQSMTVLELLQRHQNGLPMLGQKTPFYEGDENLEADDLNDGINPATLDLSERYDIIENRKEELKHLKKEHDQREKDKKSKKEAKQLKIDDQIESNTPEGEES